MTTKIVQLQLRAVRVRRHQRSRRRPRKSH